VREGYRKFFLLLGIVIFLMLDFGVVRKFSDVGEYLWIYVFFRFLFNSLIVTYSLNLFKISGSLRM
jgi:hypothetical protein